MDIGGLEFRLHAHLVDDVPYRLLLGQPFHHLLLCHLEDQLDGGVDVSIRDPANPARVFTMPSRAQVVSTGSVWVLSLSTTPILWIDDCVPDDRYARFFPRSPSAVYAYKKVAKKVRPVATSLPEDFRNIH